MYTMMAGSRQEIREQSPSDDSPVLPIAYYLSNFRQLLNFVVDSYSDILLPEELAFAADFNALPEAACRLYVRLLCRKRSVFRLDKLSYPEIDDLPVAARSLERQGFLRIDPELPVDEAAALFTKAELVEQVLQHTNYVPSEQAPHRMKREAIVALWSSLMVGDESADATISLASQVTVLAIEQEEFFDVYKLCFFGNPYQDMTEFVLRDLGLTQFESYPLDRSYRAFDNRQQLQAHLDYYRLLAALPAYKDMPAEDLCTVEKLLPDSFDGNLERRIDRTRCALARQLERLEEIQLAEDIYRRCLRPPARERRIRLLMKKAAWSDAYSLCTETLRSPYNDEENQTVSALAARIVRHSGDSFDDPWAYKPPLEQIEVTYTDESVEILAAQFFETLGDSHYTENVLFDGVFGLAFWDIIFAPLAGAFFNPFQHAPSDFYDATFVSSRQDLIDSRLKELTEHDALSRIVKQCFIEKQGIQNPMVNWRYLNEPLLDKALQRIPMTHWLAIFERLLSDTRSNRNGFPDLIVFPDNPLPCPYKLIEVKGPGDTLQKNQRRWMRFFADHGIAHSVCNVVWSDT